MTNPAAAEMRGDYTAEQLHALGERVYEQMAPLLAASDDEMVERVARALHFDFCDQLGWPNGQPTWDEMPNDTTMRRAADTLAKAHWRSLARTALAAMRGEP